MSSSRRWGPLLLWSLLMLVISLLPLAIGWGGLPDPVATHWGFAGNADASMPLAAVPLLMVGLIGVGLLTTSLFRAGKEPTPEAFAMVGLMGGLGTALVGLVVYLNWDAASWDEAGTFNPWHVGLVLAGAFAGGAAGFVVGRRCIPSAR